jgi:hypothetical protein
VAFADAASASVNAGTATWSVSGTNLPSSTVLNLALPARAACTDPGGTGAYYESFLLPTTADPSAITNTINGEGFPDQGEPLVGANGFLPSSFPAADPPGEVNPQYANDLAFSDYLANGVALTGAFMGPVSNDAGDPALFASGSAQGTVENLVAGVACFSPANVVTDYWDVPVSLTLTPTGSR